MSALGELLYHESRKTEKGVPFQFSITPDVSNDEYHIVMKGSPIEGAEMLSELMQADPNLKNLVLVAAALYLSEQGHDTISSLVLNTAVRTNPQKGE